MGKIAFVTGVSHHHSEIYSDIARQWALRELATAPYLYAAQLRGLLANRRRFKSVSELSDEDFLHGVYMALCDHFNGGCEIEDLTDEVCELLGLRPTGIPSRESVLREKREAARARREEQRLAQEAARRAQWEAQYARRDGHR